MCLMVRNGSPKEGTRVVEYRVKVVEDVDDGRFGPTEVWFIIQWPSKWDKTCCYHLELKSHWIVGHCSWETPMIGGCWRERNLRSS